MDRGDWKATVHGGCKESNMTEQLVLSLHHYSQHPFLSLAEDGFFLAEGGFKGEDLAILASYSMLLRFPYVIKLVFDFPQLICLI